MEDILKLLSILPDSVKEPVALIFSIWLIISTYGSFRQSSLIDIVLVDWLKVKKRKSKHSICCARDDAIEFGDAAADYFGSMVSFHDASMKEKMNYLDHKIVAMKSGLEAIYMKELERIDPEGLVITSDDFQVYQIVTDLFVRHIKDFGRGYIRDNHYDQMSEVQFDHYCRDVRNTCLEEGHNFLNIYYPKSKMMRITRERLHTINEPFVPTVGALTEESIRYARHKSIEYAQRLEEKRIKYETYRNLFKKN